MSSLCKHYAWEMRSTRQSWGHSVPKLERVGWGQWKGRHTSSCPDPDQTCISDPLDKPRALASSVVKPLFNVLLNDLRLARERLLSRGCVRGPGPWVADRTILSMISSAVSSVQFTGSSLAVHHGGTRPRTPPALVRVRRPGTVDVELSPLCRLVFSTAFMFSCSAASSAYWIPWGWLSCASDGPPPNLPLCKDQAED